MRKFVFAAFAVLMPISVHAQTTTTTVVVPGEVRTYILEQKSPSVAYDGDIVIGDPVPDTIKILPVPNQTKYGYAIVNERRVIVDPNTHTIVDVLE